MKNYTLLLVCILFLLNAQSLKAQCLVDAGEDIEVCGDTIQLNASLNEGDYDAFWSTSSSEIEILDVNSPTSQVVYLDGFEDWGIHSVELTWTITNAEGLICSENLNVTFKVIPSFELVLEDTACSNTSNYFECINNYSYLSCPAEEDFTVDTNVQITHLFDTCSYRLRPNNDTEDFQIYSFNLQVEFNGCLSELVEDSIVVKPRIDIFPGNDTTICGYEYTLNAVPSDPESHVRWVFCSGPWIEFPNNDAGSDSVSGNPEVEILAESPGLVTLCWREWVDGCVYNDAVLVNFLDINYCNLLSAEADIVMPSSELENDGSIDIIPIGGEPPYMYNWFNGLEENSENEDQEELSVGLYTLTLTDNNDQQHIKHNYLIANIDSSAFENPIDTLTASVDTCSFFNWEEGEIYDYVVLDDEIIVTWSTSFFAYENFEYSTFHTVTYPFENNATGVYVYTISVVCEENGTEYTVEDVIYMDFDIMTSFANKKLIESKIYPNPTRGIVNVDAKEVSEMVLTDITGRVISNRILTSTNGKSQINLSQQKSGIYLLHMKIKEGQQVVKLIKN